MQLRGCNATVSFRLVLLCWRAHRPLGSQAVASALTPGKRYFLNAGYKGYRPLYRLLGSMVGKARTGTLPSRNGFWVRKDEVMDGWSANKK